jgi:hypothetical protein
MEVVREGAIGDEIVHQETGGAHRGRRRSHGEADEVRVPQRR